MTAPKGPDRCLACLAHVVWKLVDGEWECFEIGPIEAPHICADELAEMGVKMQEATR